MTPVPSASQSVSSLVTTLDPPTSLSLDVKLMFNKQLQSAFPNIFTPLDLLSCEEGIFYLIELKLIGHNKPRDSDLTARSYKDKIRQGVNALCTKLEQ